MIRYNVHDIVEVTVDQRVSPSLRGAIDFQIAHFRTDMPTTCDTQILVRPYEDWPLARPMTACAFHLCEGGGQHWMDDPAGRCAYMRTLDGFDVYADTPLMLINMLIQLLIVPRGMTMVHAAAVADRDNNVTLLPGPGGVGKTAVLGALVQDHGYRLLGDDVVLISETGECLCFPRSFVLKAYHESVYPELFDRLDITSAQRARKSRPRPMKSILNFAADNIPFKGMLRWTMRRAGLLANVQQALAAPRSEPYLAAVPVEDVLGPDCVVERGMISRLIFMERFDGSSFEHKTMSREAMTSRLFSIIHHEWVGHMRHFWTLGSLEIADLPRYFEDIEQITINAIRHSACMRMFIPNNASPEQLVDAYRSLDVKNNREAA